MHVLQPKQVKLKKEEVEKLLVDLNISLTQLPKIKINDVTLVDFELGDVIKIERVDEDSEKAYYYRVVVV